MNLEILKLIEDELDNKEKIKILFLMLDNYNCLNNSLYLYKQCKYIISECVCEVDDWEEKLIEALCIVKNYKILIKLGKCLNDLEVKYLPSEIRSSYRVNIGGKILFKLFDSMNVNNTKIILNSIYEEIPKNEELYDIDILELHALYWIKIGYISILSGGGDFKMLLKHLKHIDDNATNYKSIEHYLENKSKRKNNLIDIQSINENIYIQNGICVIINEMNFSSTEYESRKSSIIDALNLKKTFSGMNFTVELWSDVSANEIIESLEEIGKNDVDKKYDCFVLCILSHGYTGGFITIDGVEITIDTIEQKMCSNKFKNTVKILIVQACQGENAGLTLDCSSSNSATNVIDTKIPEFQPTNIDNYKLFFLFMSTMKYYISIRHRREGSWFIEDICKVLQSRKSFGQNISIDQWSKEVKRKVQSRRGSIGKGGLVSQLPETRDRLTKEVFFPIYKEI